MRHPQYDYIPDSLKDKIKFKTVPHGLDFYIPKEEQEKNLADAEEALAKEKQEFEALKASVQSTENPVVKRRPGRPAKAN